MRRADTRRNSNTFPSVGGRETSCAVMTDQLCSIQERGRDLQKKKNRFLIVEGQIFEIEYFIQRVLNHS